MPQWFHVCWFFRFSYGSSCSFSILAKDASFSLSAGESPSLPSVMTVLDSFRRLSGLD